MKKPEIEKILLDGPQGKLEARLSSPDKVSSFVAVICHPHPLYGGSMDNKVVHYTARALMDMGMPVLRFNFRGVGGSEGEFDDAVGEIDDCLAAAEWMKQRYPSHQLVVAGFSFGAYIAAQTASRISAAALITIAPAVTLYDFNAIGTIGCPWLLIQGDADEVVSAEKVMLWGEQSTQVSKIIRMEGASHFFHGRLVELAEFVRQWVKDAL